MFTHVGSMSTVCYYSNVGSSVKEQIEHSLTIRGNISSIAITTLVNTVVVVRDLTLYLD